MRWKPVSPWMPVAIAVLASGAPGTADGSPVFRSDDRGRSWTPSDAGLPRDVRINAFGDAGTRVLAGSDAGIHVSSDSGFNWSPAEMGDAAGDRVLTFAASGGAVLAGTDGHGMVRSVDGGGTWGRIRGFPEIKVRCLLAVGGRVFAGTEGDGVLGSDDHGVTWSRLGAGLPEPGQVFALAEAGGGIFAGMYGGGLHRWDASAGVWHRVGQVRPLVLASVDGTLIAGHNPGGLHGTSDRGASWFRGRGVPAADDAFRVATGAGAGVLSPDAPVWEMGAGDGLVMAGAGAGVFRSEDRGRTWLAAGVGLPEGAPGIAFLVRRDLLLVAVAIPRGRDPGGGREDQAGRVRR